MKDYCLLKNIQLNSTVFSFATLLLFLFIVYLEILGVYKIFIWGTCRKSTRRIDIYCQWSHAL